MAEKIIPITYDIKKLVSDHKKAVVKGDFYQACLLHNRLKIFNIGSVNALQSSVYMALNSAFYETEYLLKMVSDEKFNGFNPAIIYERIALFFHVYYGK